MLKLKYNYAVSTVAWIKARLADLGTIHEAKDQLRLDEPDYRAMVAAASKGRFDTAAKLDARSRARLIKAMAARGYKKPAPSPRFAALEARRAKEMELIGKEREKREVSMEDFRKMAVAASGGKTQTSADLNAYERGKLLRALRALAMKMEPKQEPEALGFLVREPRDA